jgi:hypothetical protein
LGAQPRKSLDDQGDSARTNLPKREHEHEKQADVIITLAQTSAQLFHLPTVHPLLMFALGSIVRDKALIAAVPFNPTA